MDLKFDQKDIKHVARHLWGAPVLGGKFNSKITNAEDFLIKLSHWLAPRINADNLNWIHNDNSGTDTVEIAFQADEELKNLFGIYLDEPFGYDGVIEIPDDLRSRVTRRLREGIEINVIDGLKPKPIDGFVVQLKKQPQESAVFISTAYPGYPGPFFPEEAQTKEEYKINKEYWDKHAFIKF